MSSFDVNLSLAGMKNISPNSIQHEFSFNVVSWSYHCSPMIAQVLAPSISALCSLDASISEYSVETRDLSGQFPLFLSLGNGSAIQINEANCAFFLS
jgi:hypothetical protein